MRYKRSTPRHCCFLLFHSALWRSVTTVTRITTGVSQGSLVSLGSPVLLCWVYKVHEFHQACQFHSFCKFHICQSILTSPGIIISRHWTHPAMWSWKCVHQLGYTNQYRSIISTDLDTSCVLNISYKGFFKQEFKEFSCN